MDGAQGHGGQPRSVGGRLCVCELGPWGWGGIGWLWTVPQEFWMQDHTVATGL